MKRAIHLAAWLAAAGAVCPAHAADEAAYFSELPMVASVSRLPQRLADAPTSVTVVDRDMIKASGARDLNDIFRLVPGFQTYPNTTEPARVTYHGMGDGEYASRVQVLIDGRSMYSPLFNGGVNWATLPVALEDIERIEVVRGTNAASYGSNAFLGVINIITVDPELVRGFSVSTNYGNQNVRDYSLRTGGKLGESGAFRFTYRQQNDDGMRDRYDWKDSYATRLFDLRADFSLNNRDSLDVSIGRAEGVTQRGRFNHVTWIPNADDPFRLLRQSDTYVQTVFRRVYAADSELELRYAYAEDRSSDAFDYRLGPGVVLNVNQSGDWGSRHELEAQYRGALGGNVRYVLGGSWRQDAMSSRWYLNGLGTVQREVSRLFGNGEWKPVEWLTANAGIAADNDSFAGYHASPRASANFHLNPENTIRIGYSRAYHAAGIVDYYGNAKVGTTSYFAGVSNLPEERLDVHEIGYLGDWKRLRASLDVRVFREKISNRLFRIDMDVTTSHVGPSTVPIQDVRIRGVEYQFKWQPFEPTRIVLNQAFAKIDGEYLPSILALPHTTVQDKYQSLLDFTERSMPGHTTSILLMQKLPFGFEFSAAGYWQDKMKWSTNSWSRKYDRVDVRLGYPFRSGALGGEIALVAQSINGDHGEYKSNGGEPDDRIVEKRQWVSLRLDF